MKSLKSKNLSIKLTFVLLFVLPISIFSQASLVEKKDKTDFEKKHIRVSDREAVTIEKVLTNKSIQVYKDNWPAKIELIGIELPDWKDVENMFDKGLLSSANKDKLKQQYMKARVALKDYVSGGDVLYIQQDVRKKNAFGSLLVYLYSPNRRIINIELVRQGYAMPAVDVDNKLYDSRFKEAFQEAIDHKRGLYKFFKLKVNSK